MVDHTSVNFGVTKSYRDNETIYEEGDVSDGVFLILEGKVELFRTKEGAFHYLATFSEGMIFGEAGVLKRSERSVTVRCKGSCRLLFMKAEDFRKSLSDPLVKHIVTSMATRLQERYIPKRELIQDADPLAAVRGRKQKRKAHTGEPIIEGVTPLVIGVLSGSVKVTQMPFAVGNTRSYGEMARLSEQTLMLPLPTATDLDARHFDIIKRGRDIVIRDLGSKYGTVVNGTKVSKYDKVAELPLEVGENTVGTGGLNSKVTFLITLPEVNE